MGEKEANKQVMERWMRKRAQQLVHQEVRWDWRHEVSCSSCILRNGELHCPSVEPVTNSSASVSVPFSFEKTNYCVSRHDSHGGILVPKAEQSMRNGDPQLTGHGLLYLLLIIGLFANLVVGCSGSSPMRLDSSVLNYSFTVPCLMLASIYFLWNLWGWTNVGRYPEALCTV